MLRIAATGSSREASMPCVAPIARAYSSFDATTSTAMIGCAATSAPPCTTLSPTPPTPKTAMLAPGGTAAVLMTAPTPVITEQPTSAAISSGILPSILIAQDSCTTVIDAYVAT